MPSITPLIQPNADTCGQTCIAMALGIPLKDAIAIFGKKCTNKAELAQILLGCGFEVDLAPKSPARAICRIRYRNARGGWRKRSHWVLMWDGVIYDPLGPEMTAVIGIGKRNKKG